MAGAFPFCWAEATAHSQPEPSYSNAYYIDGPEAIVTGDFDGDGNLDLMFVTGNYNGNLDANFFLGNGDGTFRTGYVSGSLGAGIGTGSLAVGDVTGDGKPDLIVYSTVNGNSSVENAGEYWVRALRRM